MEVDARSSSTTLLYNEEKAVYICSAETGYAFAQCAVPQGDPLTQPQAYKTSLHAICETHMTKQVNAKQVLRNKLDALYHHLGAKGSLDFVNLDRFKMKTKSKTGITDLL